MYPRSRSSRHSRRAVSQDRPSPAHVDTRRTDRAIAGAVYVAHRPVAPAHGRYTGAQSCDRPRAHGRSPRPSTLADEDQNHDDFPKLDHRAAPCDWAKRDRVSDPPPVPRARPEARRLSTGEFSNGTSGENYSGINRAPKPARTVLAGALPERGVTVHSGDMGYTIGPFAGSARCPGRCVNPWMSV